MKRSVILITLLALLLLSCLALTQVALAQGPVGEGEPEPGGMPGYPAPDKPIPYHEPGHLSRASSYRTQVVRENELGAQELVEISGVDAMAADGIDPLAGNYTLVDWQEILFSVSSSTSQSGEGMFNPLSSWEAQKVTTLEKYAPQIWLSKDAVGDFEFWPPLPVENAFTGLRRRLIGGQYWVETKDPLTDPRLTQSWAYCATDQCVAGRVAAAPVYAFWVVKEGNGLKFVDLVYFFYFPYNRGKEVMNTVWENHVGDWEHVTVRLTSNWNESIDPLTLQPERIYLSAHSFGYEYPWASFDKLGTHPIVYTAWGSHGMWKDPGTHCYEEVLWTDLCDVTNAYRAWNTWNNVKGFDFNAKQGIPGGSEWPVWLRDDYSTACADPGCDPSEPANGPIFRWGNSGGWCEDFPFVGEYCRLTVGPTGPIAKPALSSNPFSEFSPVSDDFHLQSFQLISTTFDFIPDSRYSIGNFNRNDIAAGDLNGDGQAEQIAAWLGANNHIQMSIGELPGSARTTSAPAAVVHPDGSLDLAVRGYDNALWQQGYDGSSWGDWSNGAGFLLSGPAIVSQGNGQSSAYAIGTDNQVYRTGSNRGWRAVEPTGDWSPVIAWHGPTPELPAPAVVARGNGLDLFRLGPDNTLRWQHSDDGSTWGDWQSLGGMLASGPGVISWGPDHMQVFARGVDETLWHRTYNGSWGPWQRLELNGMDAGVTIASAPTAVSPGSGQIRVYVRGSDNKPYWLDYTGGGWGSWQKGGGHLASGVAAVWQTDHYELFVQKADGKLQQSSNGVNWNDWTELPPRGLYIDTGLIGNAFPLADWGNHYDFSVDVETGHFSGDGREQIVLAYNTTDKAALAVGDWTGVEFNWVGVYNFPDWPCADPARFIRVTTGNYDGEGRDEVGVVLACGTKNNAQDIREYQVQILKVNPPPNSTSGYEIGPYCTGCKSDKYGHPKNPNNRLINTIIVKSGDFDADANGADELVVGSSWWLDGQNEWWDHGQMYQIFKLEDKTTLTSSSTAESIFRFHRAGFEVGDFSTARCLHGFDLAVGNVDDDPADEFVTLFNISDYYYGLLRRSLLVYDFQGGDVLSPNNWKVNDGSFKPPLPTGKPYIIHNRQAYRDRLVVADLDHDLVDEVGYLFNNSPHTADWGNTFQLDIYQLHESLPGEWYKPPVAASLQLTIPNAGYYNPHLVADDFTGESLRVGPPSYRVQTRVDTLVAHLNMPPKHRDLVKDTAGDYQLIESPEGECSPSPDSPDCTHAKYAALDFSSSEQTITTQHAYEISAGMENEACVGGGLGDIAEAKACVRTSINATHGGNFEKSTEEIESIGFRRKVIAANDDKVVYFGTPYGVWEYPVLAGAAGVPSKDVFITVVFPLISITQYPDTSGGYYSGTCDETWYSAGHQPNNVWSYDPIGEVTFEDYDPNYDLTYDAIEGDWAEGEITYEKLQSAFSSVSFAHSVSAGVETEVSGKAKMGFVNVSGSFKAYVKGKYSYTGMETDKLTTGEETTFSYFLAPQPDSSKFTTRVLFYRAKDGYQVLNYQAEPGRAADWQLYDKPDPAFILPWYGFPDPDNPQVPPCGEDQKLFSPNIVINPSHVSLGETVSISATVRNYSGELARNVLVRFYQGDPANDIFIGERIIPFLSRETGPETVSITWAAAGVGRQKIYAVIDPYDTIPEMHDEDDLINNNMAYGFIQLAATNFADMGLVAEQPPYDAISYQLEDPRPSVSLYVPRTSLDAVARFEVGGTEIGLPVEGRVFEVVAYQGSKYKLWSDPIANFNLKPEANDPPAVIIIAYTQADISTLAENDLKLYRLEGTNWTEATCPGYQIERFPVEDLIAVPICQTGIFAFSDVAPGPIVAPVAQFSATPLSGTAPLTVTFTDLSSNFPTSWAWDFGDGATATAQNPTHTYSEAGVYDVSLTASNEAGSNTHTKPSYITVYGMRADFMATPVLGSAPLMVTFTDLSTGIGIPGPTSWAWDFGDVTSSTEQHPSHTYVETGTYTVTLTVSNGDASDTKVDQNCVTVSDVSPTYLPLLMKDGD